VKRLPISALWASGLFLALAAIAPSAAAAQPSGAAAYFGSLPALVDQDGRPVQLYADLMKGKVVVIDAIFTTCQGACPVMSRNFAKIQDWLGDRLGKEVYLISISVDPATDTPAKLKEYASRFNARPGWYFLTGAPEKVAEVLKKLGQYTEKPDDHLNLFLVGNEATGLWKKAFGLADAGQLIPIVDSVLQDRGKDPTKGTG
jgi:protein SCO1/2